MAIDFNADMRAAFLIGESSVAVDWRAAGVGAPVTLAAQRFKPAPSGDFARTGIVDARHVLRFPTIDNPGFRKGDTFTIGAEVLTIVKVKTDETGNVTLVGCDG
jgi:hypothetical protein